ncbi:Peroxisomal assembly protein PEX3 [Phaffia rhodozyma]|uniref:Peroxisomal assembly protein PEX3 n=1 Tax=Phaffia rhodozyma TaxID=264483 RepID=A0A0F7SUN6_PHARH|nr:Peroxisomal assembly protein PEX3 [Phaffia rhodozyma]
MLTSIKQRARRHSKAIAVSAGVIGGVYLAGAYALDRLREIQERALDERRAKENLKRRFLQNQEDATFTLAALLPTLSPQILEAMEVEDLHRQLAQLTKPSPTSTHTSTSSPKSIKASKQKERIQVQLGDMGDSVVSLSASSVASSEEAKSIEGGEEASSKTKDEGSSESRSEDRQVASGLMGESWASEFKAASQAGSMHAMDASVSSFSTDVSESVISDSTLASSHGSGSPHVGSSYPPLPPSAPASPPPEPEPPVPSKTKTQIWNELKLLTFTRTITTIYTLVLLSLQTRVQLNILGRHAYLRSVREPDSGPSDASHTPESSWWNLFIGAPDIHEQKVDQEIEISEDDELVYLSFGWWLVHVGWKEVGQRVKLAVEEVFTPISLKKMIDRTDVEILLSEVRRKVEWDLGGDGIPRPHSFVPHLLPQTPTQEAHLLSTSSLSPSPSFPVPQIDPASPLRALLVETSQVLRSSNFGKVLDECLAVSFEALVSGLEAEGGLGLSVNRRLVDLEERESRGKRLAEVLGGVAKWGRKALDVAVGNIVVDTIAELPSLMAFSATIYSNYDIGNEEE